MLSSPGERAGVLENLGQRGLVHESGTLVWLLTSCDPEQVTSNLTPLCNWG